MTEIDFAQEEKDYFAALDRMEEQAARRYSRALLAHPDCVDPDHPGCGDCDDE